MTSLAAARSTEEAVSLPANYELKHLNGVVELLRAALEALPANGNDATTYITKACSVLEATSASVSNLEGVCAYARGGLLPWQVKRIGQFIDANLDKPLSAEQLSAEVRLGPDYFQRAFKKSFGVSPHTFLVQRRIARAQELMLSTDHSLAEIALTVGFSDQAHFTTRFRRAVGATPGLWRRAMSGHSESAEIRCAA